VVQPVSTVDPGCEKARLPHKAHGTVR